LLRSDLGERIAQLRKWAEDEAPKIFWLGGLTFPTGFLTALLQMAAPKLGASVDSLTWEFPVMSFNESSITMRPREGAYIKELYLEGARWDSDNACLAEPNPMELFSMMPIIHFKPVRPQYSSVYFFLLCVLTLVGSSRAGRPAAAGEEQHERPALDAAVHVPDPRQQPRPAQLHHGGGAQARAQQDQRAHVGLLDQARRGAAAVIRPLRLTVQRSCSCLRGSRRRCMGVGLVTVLRCRLFWPFLTPLPVVS
jgi:hypothetical protein